MHRTAVLLIALFALRVPSLAAPPRPVDERLEITLFAEHPTIVTPTGIDVDHAGRVWAIESNTHFPPEGYARHDSDRLYVMRDADGDGRADDVRVFADSFTHTMSVAVRPVWLDPVKSHESGVESRKSGDAQADASASARQVFLAERSAIWLLEDLDDDLKCDRRRKLVRLDTPGTYPHNGFAGFAFDAMGWMYFGFGENLGAEYTIHGSDGTQLSGGGEGGNVYRCRPDGSKLELWATGFWNPHASCIDAFGRLFTVDNDPDSRPPCRLLHVIDGGDYGFKFRNGRKGLHPFTSWNGEIPGTLPMVAGTGEAPSGIVAYESDGLPEDYIGNLLVTSWGDHRIDRFRLEPKGASFTSIAEPIIQGDDQFRPVGLALAPDGSLFCTDWVKNDYKLHGHGRIWRISWKERPEGEVIDADDVAKVDEERLRELLGTPRLDVRRAAGRRMSADEEGSKKLLSLLGSQDARARVRVEALWSLVDGTRERNSFIEGIDVLFECLTALSTKDRDKAHELIHDEVSTAAIQQMPLILQSTNREDIEAAAYALGYATGGNESIDQSDLPLISKYGGFSTELATCRFNHGVGGGPDVEEFARDPFLFHALVHAASTTYSIGVEGLEDRQPLDAEVVARWLKPSAASGPYTRRMLTLARRRAAPEDAEFVVLRLADPDPGVRRVAVQWAAEENLRELRPRVAAVLESPGATPDLFRVTIAALQMLDGIDPKEIDRTPPTQYVMSLVRDTERPARVRALALRMLGDGASREPKAKFDSALARELLASDSPELRLETVRTLQTIPQPFAAELARPIASDETADGTLRAEAVVALGTKPTDADRDVLLELLQSRDEGLRLEALRSLRPLVKTDEVVAKAVGEIDDARLRDAASLARGEKPEFSEEAGLPDGGDALAGRRVFFHASGPGCFKCHTVNGRGGNVGPDLSLIARTMMRPKLAESILEPSKEVAPQFTNWTFVMTDGKVRNGMILRQTRHLFEIGTPEGERIEFSSSLVEERAPQRVSVMPAKLRERMTSAEFRDLLAYLETLE